MNYLQYTTEEEALKLIEEALKDLSDGDAVTIHNEYCEAVNNHDNMIHSNDEMFLEENFSTISEAVRAATYGDYSFNHEWVQFNGYANLESTNDPTSEIDYSEIAQYIFDNENEFSSLPFELEETEEEEEA